ncbi:unnamed protein product [Polarella glacialis]|uniref:Methyltransferase domain-containing protein n=1 Tax=Polarella glacialis TaxID=89957 RepID=A0A813HRX0_POLGL|nr:unnamed protein product [Polarella glacialis]
MPITFRNELRLLVKPNVCWDAAGEYTFDRCCSSILEATDGNLFEVFEHRSELHGARRCFIGDLTYDYCCSLNANTPMSQAQHVNYNHAVWLVQLLSRRGMPARSLKVIQGAVLENWVTFKGIHLGQIPYQNVSVDGLLWSPLAVLLLELTEFRFPVDESRRFLDLAAGTGAASLVALARGFSVWSSDLRPESEWQRSASAVASFGPGSAEVTRLQTLSLDILDPASWPVDAFDVIHLVQLAQKSDGRKSAMGAICPAFRDLVRRLLRPGGVALYFRQQWLTDELNLEDAACLEVEFGLRVRAHMTGEALLPTLISLERLAA